MTPLGLAIVCGLLSIVYAIWASRSVMNADAGNERMQEIADLGPWIVSDEIYHGLVYEGQEHSILEYTSPLYWVGQNKGKR